LAISLDSARKLADEPREAFSNEGGISPSASTATLGRFKDLPKTRVLDATSWKFPVLIWGIALIQETNFRSRRIR
jgi:hypothetical protein